MFLALGFFWGSLGCEGRPQQEKQSESTQEEIQAEPLVEQDASLPEEALPPEPIPIEKIEPPKPIADGVTARVTHVTDGDTVYVVTGIGARSERIRLKGYNAPECLKQQSGAFQACNEDDEFYGMDSYLFVRNLLASVESEVTIRCEMAGAVCEQDSFDRYLASLTLRDGRDLGEEVLRAGAAWTYTSFSFARMGDYCRAEAEAIKAKRGMWKDGRAAVRAGMSQGTRSWYYNSNYTRSHDGICDQAMGESFAKAAGE